MLNLLFDSQFCIICDVKRKPNDKNLLDVDLLVSDIKKLGAGEVYKAKDVEDTISIILKNAKPNDTVLIMSNGGFGNIHQKLLKSL